VVPGLDRVAAGLAGVGQAAVGPGLVPGRVRLGCEPESGGVVRAGLAGVAGPDENVPEAVERVGLQAWIADLARDDQRLLEGPGRLLEVAEAQVGVAEPGQDPGCAGCAADFPEQGQGRPEVSGRVLEATQPQLDNAEPRQAVAFRLPVTDLAGQVQGLPVIADRIVVAALHLPDQAEVGERARLAEPVADLAEDGDAFLLVAGGLVVAAQAGLSQAQVAQRASRTKGQLALRPESQAQGQAGDQRLHRVLYLLGRDPLPRGGQRVAGLLPHVRQADGVDAVRDPPSAAHVLPLHARGAALLLLARLIQRPDPPSSDGGSGRPPRPARPPRTS